MANAVSNVCDMYIKEETRHFCESLTREERVNKELFVKSFKEHILYSLLILSFDGDEDEVTAYMDDLYVDEEEVECTDENRCEECCHCNRTRPCECGCGYIGGTCDEQHEKYEAEWARRRLD